MEQDAKSQQPAILVVDDSRLMRVAARKILKEHFRILEAEDGEVAWELLQRESGIAAVMSDLSMPNLDGLGLLDRIRSSDVPGISGLPVVIVTGAEDDTTAKEQALERGASDFITKPFDSVQLVARTRAQIRLQSTEQALEKQSGMDALTGLLNLGAFQDRGQKDMAFAMRHGTDLSLLRLEVRDFNQVFLRHGKAAAEQLLQDVAGVLKEHLRREDSAARLGMTQFGVLLPAGSPGGAHSLARRFAERITALEYGFGNASFNIGIASLSLASTPDWATLQQEAENHLDRAKDRGRDSIECHPSGREDTGPPVRDDDAARPPDSVPDLDTAIARIACGDEAGLQPHLDDLMRRLLPLLELWDRSNGSALSVCVNTLRRKLERD